MLNKGKRLKLDKTIENKVIESRSDWDKKHSKLLSGIYKCRKCGGDKTTQFEMWKLYNWRWTYCFHTYIEYRNGWKI